MRACVLLLPLASGLLLAGCGGPRSSVSDSGEPAARSNPSPPTYDTGQALILEYHEITVEEKRWVRTADNFRKDLQRLYDEGYRPVTLTEYLDASFNLPPGTTPVVLTFDDATPGQFRFLPDGGIDPDCAVGILEAFHERHPDFPAKAVFYVLPPAPFGQTGRAAEKLRWLVEHGCEIGNHTVSHPHSLAKLSDEEVQSELGGAIAKIREMAPEAKVTSVALPNGIAPTNRSLLAKGTYEGKPYEMRAALLVGAGPVPAPHSPDLDPYRLPRVQAVEGDYGITFWLDYFTNHPDNRLRVK